MRVADYISQFLVTHGVSDIFVLTGAGAMYLDDAITSNPDLKYYCVRNEAAAPMMAEAYARAKGTPGAVCVTAGPGTSNAVSGLAEAWVDAAPIIVIAGEVPKNHSVYLSGATNVRSFGTAEINIIPVVSPITKYAVMVSDPNQIRYHLEKAFYCATSGRPGPVWLSIPLDVQSVIIDPETLPRFEAVPEVNANIDSEVKNTVEILMRSSRPLIVGGQGIRQAGAVSEFKKFVERLNAPIMFSRLGLDILPFSHPLNLGLAGIKGSKYCAKIMKEVDCVIAVGSRLAVPFVGYDMDAFSKGAKVIAVDIEKGELQKQGIPITIPVHADAKIFLEKMLSALNGVTMPDWQEWRAHCEQTKNENPMVLPDSKKNPIDLYYFMSRLDAASGKNNIFITDAGSNYYVGGQVFRFEHGEREVTSGTFAAMGLSVPLSIGAAIAKPDAQILAVTGDGSLELNIQELKTLSYYKLNVKLFVINNGGYVSMRNWQDTFFEGRHIGSDDETGTEMLQLRKVADTFGLPYVSIVRAEEIDEKIQEIKKMEGPVFVEVVTDSNQKIIEPIKEFSAQ